MVVIWLSYACFLRILGVLSGGRGGVLHWGGVDQGSVFEHHEFYVYYANGDDPKKVSMEGIKNRESS